MSISNVHGGRLRLTEHRSHYEVRTTVGELLDLGRTPIGSNEYNAARAQDRFDEFGDRWDWFGMPREAALSLHDYPEGLALADEYRKVLPTIHAAGIGRRNVWATDGDEFDRDRFDSGVDECWRTRRRTSRIVAKPILKLTCEIGGDCRKTADQLAWAGAAAFAVCDAAEEAGYQLEIEAVYHGECVYQNGRGVICSIGIKQAGEPLDRETAILALACPAFFRWHFIQSLCCVADSNVEGGFGAVATVPPSHVGDLHIGRCHSAADAHRQVAQLMQKIAELAGEPVAA